MLATCLHFDSGFKALTVSLETASADISRFAWTFFLYSWGCFSLVAGASRRFSRRRVCKQISLFLSDSQQQPRLRLKHGSGRNVKSVFTHGMSDTGPHVSCLGHPCTTFCPYCARWSTKMCGRTTWLVDVSNLRIDEGDFYLNTSHCHYVLFPSHSEPQSTVNSWIRDHDNFWYFLASYMGATNKEKAEEVSHKSWFAARELCRNPYIRWGEAIFSHSRKSTAGEWNSQRSTCWLLWVSYITVIGLKQICW